MKSEDIMSAIDERAYLSKEYLKDASAIVQRQMQENPFLGISVDPDVADYMGVFQEKALTEDDLDDVIISGGTHNEF